MSLERYHSGAPWESVHGYCRAVRAGNQVSVSGTTAVGSDGEIVGIGDAYAQAVRCFEIIQDALQRFGLSASAVTRTRVYLVNVDDWPDVARAHAEVFREHPPASTMLEVSRLIGPEMLLEVEADAFVADPEHS